MRRDSLTGRNYTLQFGSGYVTHLHPENGLGERKGHCDRMERLYIMLLFAAYVTL